MKYALEPRRRETQWQRALLQPPFVILGQAQRSEARPGDPCLDMSASRDGRVKGPSTWATILHHPKCHHRRGMDPRFYAPADARAPPEDDEVAEAMLNSMSLVAQFLLFRYAVA